MQNTLSFPEINIFPLLIKTKELVLEMKKGAAKLFLTEAGVKLHTGTKRGLVCI